jgi:hypothetical protein
VKNLVHWQYLLFTETWRHSKFGSNLCKIRLEKHITAFVKVVEGSEIYNFPIHHFVHFYSTFWSYTCSNGGTGKHSASRAATSHAAHLRRAVPRPAPPGAPYRGAHRPEASRPEAPRSEWHGCRTHDTSCLRRRTRWCSSAQQGGRGRPPIRATNSSSHRRAPPPHRLGLRPDALSCRPEPPAGASRGSCGELRVPAGRKPHQALLHLP